MAAWMTCQRTDAARPHQAPSLMMDLTALRTYLATHMGEVVDQTKRVAHIPQPTSANRKACDRVTERWRRAAEALRPPPLEPLSTWLEANLR